MIPKNKRFSLALVLLMCLTLCLTALSAVSYTHLDVYKRQVQGHHRPDAGHLL